MRTGCHVLLADDDENDVTFLRRAFRQAEISKPLHVVHDGQAVVDYLCGAREFSDRLQYPLPCLVLLDLQMPRKNGLEALEWARSQITLQALPIIMLTSSVQPSEIATAYQIGANAFVSKPSGTPERAELARFIKGFWLTFNQIP